MGEVIVLGGWTKLPIPVERVLDGAKDCDYVLVLGWKGNEMWAASSESNMDKALYLCTKFIHRVHAGDFS